MIIRWRYVAGAADTFCIKINPYRREDRPRERDRDRRTALLRPNQISIPLSSHGRHGRIGIGWQFTADDDDMHTDTDAAVLLRCGATHVNTRMIENEAKNAMCVGFSSSLDGVAARFDKLPQEVVFMLIQAVETTAENLELNKFGSVIQH